ncbi:serine-threonine/tyrosine-protein kinase catalytic domain-containing protein [Artemisia annua]|uniref:non-specific serine/threonine protein kinase n=1 Tax=Artemisia annua TaxID=35608 RepID=A0A2U1KIV0_ARTAN|nr:serine-threonine/tyrosine-protein kinase catalytic domain-containing protein [Artemisia annua]
MEGNDHIKNGFLRADQIDLKSLDEQLQRHLNTTASSTTSNRRARSFDKNTSSNLNLSISGMNFSSSSYIHQRPHHDHEQQTKHGDGVGYQDGSTMPKLRIDTNITRKRQEWEIDPSKLVIKSVIARGSFGTVHRGIYDGLDVAVKLLDWGEEGHRTDAEIASLRAAFTQEVVVWYKLDHPNVTKFIGATMGTSELNIQADNGHFGLPRNSCCVVVEYLPGGALKSFLIKNRRRKLAFKVVMQLALDLARGLNYLHTKKIVHRDVKTENMLLDKSRTLKIADFGVARIEASNPNDMTGETGTLGYMAPEVLNGSAYNRKCDVYSFGICLWEIYCCDMPYPDLSFSEVTSAVVRQNLRPEIPRCCPNSLATVMKRCWDANPDKRPEMDEVVTMLEAIDTSKGGGMIPGDQEQQGCFCFNRTRGP